MKILFSILREMADLPNDPDAVALALNSLGLAVEEMDVVGVPVPGVVTARIVRMEKHPDAAKVTRCFVDAGDGEERHVWCGATNMQPGDIVPLATLGTTMPNGMEIARRGILGIDSEGMLCSEVELGLSDESSGLLILPSDSPLGVSPFDVLDIEHDVIFDLDLTRNRADCWGHLGVARDLAASGIRVNTVAPGLIDTPIYGQGDQSEAFKAQLQKGVLFPQKLGKPEQLASMVLECVTNSYMNAETIRVDGGIRMPPK